MSCIIATVFSTLAVWLNILSGFSMRKTALVVPEEIGLMPGLLETATSEAKSA